MVEIEDNKILESFKSIIAKEDKVVPLKILDVKENNVELQIELHYIGFPPETRNVSIPTANKLLIEKHLKQIWNEQKPTIKNVELSNEIKIE